MSANEVIDKETLETMDDQLSYADIEDQISDVTLRPRWDRGWVLGFLTAFGLFNIFIVSIGWLLYKGVGIWGINIPVGWGFDIINFVWWIGIGHAGTLISAILLLFRQDWRTSINRFAEAMTLFAVACAGVFPLMHLGRPWLAYWLFPLPNVMQMWPQFRSPLMWDVFAVSTYATVSAIFWYIGLIPDCASYRDRAKNKAVRFAFGILSMGWRGASTHWHRYELAYLLLAGLSTPLVLSVHTIVSYDFAVSVLPGWHTTVFPPYFVAGAVYAGFAMVITLMVPMRIYYKLRAFVTLRHLDLCAKVMLATGLIVAYGYAMEMFTAWYSGNFYEKYVVIFNRKAGPYAFQYWALIVCNVIVPQALWFPKVRQNPALLFIVAMFVNVGMWLERFIIVVQSIHRDFLPSSWGMFSGTIWDWGLYIGTIGLFLTLLFIFIRILPVISIAEMKLLKWERSHQGGAKH